MLDPQVRRIVAGILVAALGLVLVSALLPFAGGLLGGPMLYVLWEPLQRRLVRLRVPAPLAAGVIILLTLILIVVPGIWLVTMLVDQAQSAAQSLLASPLLGRLDDLRVGPIAVGPALVSAGQNLVTWLGSNALALLGTAARVVLNLVFAFFGLYFLLIRPGRAWAVLEPYLPFSRSTSALLRDRFTAVTFSTVIGTGLIAAVQGTLIGLAFWVTGIPNAVFWGAVTVVLAILPLVGSGMVWIPGAVGLFFSGEPAKAVGLILWGAIVVGNVDALLRPMVYNRYAKIHPMITLVGAIVGVQQMGFVGLILGPLAISYFFELARLFTVEYGHAQEPAALPPVGETSAAPAVAEVVVGH